MRLSIRYGGLVRAASLALLLVGSGCATANQVRSIVSESNAATFASSVAGSELLPGEANQAAASWQDQVARIETFISAHPDQPRLINQLRLRQALLLVNADRPNLARAVFAEIDGSQLAGERDQVLFRLRDHLIWWYGVGASRESAGIGGDSPRAESAIAALAGEADSLSLKSDLRRFLEEMRVRVALRWAQSLGNDVQITDIVRDAATRYASQFDSTDQAAIRRWHEQPDQAVAATSLSALRWYDYVPTAFGRVKRFVDRFGLDTALVPSWVPCLDGGC